MIKVKVPVKLLGSDYPSIVEVWQQGYDVALGDVETKRHLSDIQKKIPVGGIQEFIKITVDISPYSDIEKVILEAINTAALLMCSVQFDFNGVEMVVTHATDPENALNIYRKRWDAISNAGVAQQAEHSTRGKVEHRGGSSPASGSDIEAIKREILSLKKYDEKFSRSFAEHGFVSSLITDLYQHWNDINSRLKADETLGVATFAAAQAAPDLAGTAPSSGTTEAVCKFGGFHMEGNKPVPNGQRKCAKLNADIADVLNMLPTQFFSPGKLEHIPNSYDYLRGFRDGVKETCK